MNQPATSGAVPVERFSYDDDIVRKFVFATAIWGAVAMLVGVYLAFELVLPGLNANLPWLTFGRLRPLHTNAAIFAFAGNANACAFFNASRNIY